MSREEEERVAALFLLLIAIVAGLGFVVEALFWVALALFGLWLAGWLAHPAGRRWYSW